MATVARTLQQQAGIKSSPSPSNLTVKSYGPDTDFGYVCTVTLTLEMSSGQGHATPLSQGHQLWETLSRSNMAVTSYGQERDFGYECTVTLALEIWPWIKVMKHSWAMDNNCVKYHPDPTWSEELWPGQGFWVWVHCDLILGGITLSQGHENNCVKYYLYPTWQ